MHGTFTPTTSKKYEEAYDTLTLAICHAKAMLIVLFNSFEGGKNTTPDEYIATALQGVEVLLSNAYDTASKAVDQ